MMQTDDFSCKKVKDFFRPLYTCGAFNRKAQRAVMYNTANGTCYTFEDVSALLVNEVLEGKRECLIDTAHIADVTGTTEEQVVAFCRESLMPIGLVHDHVFSDEEWQQYRKDNPPCIGAKGYEPVSDYRESLPEELRVSLTFELTYACSERCLHCFNEGAARSDLHEEHRLRPDMLTLADYKRIIDEAVELGIPEVTVTGGDPFSYPHCWDILDYMHARNLAVNLFTNAQALNSSDKIRRIARMGLQQFSVSIYSTDAEVHDQITRRSGSWLQSMKVLREMAEWPVPLNLKTPVFRLNTRTYYGVRDIARQLGAENEVSCVLSPGADGDVSLIEHLQTRPEALRIILKDPLANSHAPADAPSRSEKGISRLRPARLLSVLPSALLCWRVIGETCRRHLHAERDTRRRMPDSPNPYGTVPTNRTGHRSAWRQEHRGMSGCSACRESTRVPQENQNLILKQESIRNPRLPGGDFSLFVGEALCLLANEFCIVEIVDTHRLSDFVHRLSTHLARLFCTFL